MSHTSEISFTIADVDTRDECHGHCVTAGVFVRMDKNGITIQAPRETAKKLSDEVAAIQRGEDPNGEESSGSETGGQDLTSSSVADDDPPADNPPADNPPADNPPADAPPAA